MANLSHLEGRAYGPVDWTVTPEAVADFVDLTGAERIHAVPPGFAAAALFAVAPDLLGELYEMSVIHGEQSFVWLGPLRIGETYQITGRVSSVRERAGIHFITFEVDAEAVIAGARFLVSGQAAAAGGSEEQPEPRVGDRGDLGAGQVSATRVDLVRYASATRDWNPVHWDHESAVEAGFGGVVVHGLLQAGWILAAVSDRTIRSAKFRFRNPLFPAQPVSVVVAGNKASLTDGETEYVTATLEYADE